MSGDPEEADVVGEHAGLMLTTETSRRRNGGLRSLAVGGMDEHAELALVLVEAGREIDRLQRQAKMLTTVLLGGECVADAFRRDLDRERQGACGLALMLGMQWGRHQRECENHRRAIKARKNERRAIRREAAARVDGAVREMNIARTERAAAAARAEKAEFIARAALANPDAAAFGQGYDAGWKAGAQAAAAARLPDAESEADIIHALRAQVLEGAALAVRSMDAERAAAAMAERDRCLRIVREAPLAPDTKVGARQLDLKRRIAEAIERGDG